MRLDQAGDRIEAAGLEYESESDGLFGVLDESNWVVCEQSPSAGEVATAVTLTVRRECGEEAAPAETENGDDADGGTGGALGPKEQAWAAGMAEWAETMGSAFTTFSELASDETTVALLLLGDQDTVIAFAVPIAQFPTCAQSLKQTAGAPPTKRLRPIHRLVQRACGKYKLAGDRLAAGIDSQNAELIDSANTAMTTGTRLVQRAQNRLQRLAASS